MWTVSINFSHICNNTKKSWRVMQWRVVQILSFMDFDVYFTAAYGWMEFRPVLLSCKGQIRSCYRAIPPWYIRHTYEESTHHMYFQNLLNYWVIAFYLSALTQFRPIYTYKRGVPGVCTPHLDDLRRWSSGLWFGFDQHPMEAGACLISAKLEHLSFFCFFFLSSCANWISALPASPWSSRTRGWAKAAIQYSDAARISFPSYSCI